MWNLQTISRFVSLPLHKRTWFIILMLILFAPVGIYLLWSQQRNWRSGPKLIASVLAAIYFIVAISNPSSADTEAITATLGIAPTTQLITVSEQSLATASPTETPSQTDINPTPYMMKVHFLNVGQGAATLIQIGDKTMIVDGGDWDASSFVVAYLKKQGISQIDVMVATHYDSDHISGLVGALNVFPVKQVYDCPYTTDTRVFNSFKNMIKVHAIPESSPVMKQTIQLGEATVTFVSPRQYGNADENDDSICVRIQFGTTSFLIMGDSSANAEQQILAQNLKSDVLLASHHGSDGCNSKTLLANVKPEFIVISCGADNPYGHPGKNTMNRIKNTGAALYRTDKQGTIICTSDGNQIIWDKSPSNDFTPGATTIQTTTSEPASQ